MQWAKAKRMWFFYYRGGGVHYISTPMRIWQVCSSSACGAGLLAGLIRRRDPLLGAVLLTVAFSTLIHTIVVSQARYNVPLMPTLIAAGIAGWFLALRRRPARHPPPSAATAELPRPVPGPGGEARAILGRRGSCSPDRSGAGSQRVVGPRPGRSRADARGALGPEEKHVGASRAITAAGRAPPRVVEGP